MAVALPLDQIICGDNCEVLGTFPSDCIDLVVTSPPYGNIRTYGGHNWDFDDVAQQLWRVVKPGGVVVWVIGDKTIDGSKSGESFRQALRFNEIGFRLHDTMIYHRQGKFPQSVRYWQDFEFMFVLSNGKPKVINIITDVDPVGAVGSKLRHLERHGGVDKLDWIDSKRVRRAKKARSNIWYIPAGHFMTDDGFRHPAMFPEALPRDHILSWSDEGGIVCDPFNGSGTTTKMAHEMGRRFIGIDVNPEYCEIARNRLSQKLLFGLTEPEQQVDHL